MTLLSPELEVASPARQFTANWEPTLDEILEEPIVRQLMARDGVTEPTLRRLANKIGESLIPTRLDRAEVPFYSDHSCPRSRVRLPLWQILMSATRSSATTWRSGPDRMR